MIWKRSRRYRLSTSSRGGVLAYQSDLSLTGLDMILGRLSLRSVVALGEGFTRRKGLYPMGIAAVLCGVA